MELNEYQYIIVGSGFLGSVLAERIATVLNQPVLVIEKRNHIGGNCYSETDPDTNIETHKYGTHIFHTSNKKVWDYINQFTSFNAYRHQVLASYNEKIYQLPINLETINSFFNVNLRPYEVDDFLASKKNGTNGSPRNFEEKAISMIGVELYEAFIKGYTLKQWQMNPAELPASVFSRLPFRKSYDESYFYDTWQGIPLEGYHNIFKKLLGNSNIRVLTDTDYFSIKALLNPGATLVYSGPIDRFFEYKYGKLTWRTLRFEKEVIPVEDYQGNAVINYPDFSVPYTRIHEPKHLHPERDYPGKQTVIFKEYSLADTGDNPYYPIPSEKNNTLYKLYKDEADQLKNVFISGRLGDYKYYDMHQTIDRALEIFETSIAPSFHSNK